MEIKRVGSQASSKGNADYFTGTVCIDPLLQAAAPTRAVGASVTFEPVLDGVAYPPPRSNADRDSGLWAWRSGGEARSKIFGRVMWSGSRRARSTGTELRRPRP